MTMASVDLTPPEVCEAAGHGVLARAVLSLIGSGLAFAAFGLWLVPGSNPDPELSLMKLGLSLFMLIGGATCLLSARARG